MEKKYIIVRKLLNGVFMPVVNPVQRRIILGKENYCEIVCIDNLEMANKILNFIKYSDFEHMYNILEIDILSSIVKINVAEDFSNVLFFKAVSVIK